MSENSKLQIKSDEDLSKLNDYELLKGARDIDLLSEVGYKQLEHIRYMRNEMSAAHPNNNGLKPFQMLSFLETCISEVICSQESEIALKVKKLLGNIKKQAMSKSEIENISAFI
ncbi:hypothetical protein WGV30_01945 [Campylobacter jejuni]